MLTGGLVGARPSREPDAAGSLASLLGGASVRGPPAAGPLGRCLAGPHVTLGSVPATKAIITGRTQPPLAVRSTGASTT